MKQNKKISECCEDIIGSVNELWRLFSGIAKVDVEDHYPAIERFITEKDKIHENVSILVGLNGSDTQAKQ